MSKPVRKRRKQSDKNDCCRTVAILWRKGGFAFKFMYLLLLLRCAYVALAFKYSVQKPGYISVQESAEWDAMVLIIDFLLCTGCLDCKPT